MHKNSLAFICLLAVQSVVGGKSLFEYNVNPHHDLVAEGATSYSNFWPFPSAYGSYQRHSRHQHGYGYDSSDDDYYDGDSFDSDSDEYDDDDFNNHRHPHPGHGGGPHRGRGQHHGMGPHHGRGRKGHKGHGGPHHHAGHGGPPLHAGNGGLPPGQVHKLPPIQQPPRFPPPPVYDNDFINPWKAIPSQPSEPEPAVTIATPTTEATTPQPPITEAPTIPSSTTDVDGLIYDIDVRFGQ